MSTLPLRTLIIDDEPNAVRVVQRLLEQSFHNQVAVIATTNDPEEAVALIDRLQPELVFLDIRMHGKSGFDVLHAVNYRSFQVIFITAYDEYALRAFRENAVDYLLKPVDPGHFQTAVQKVLDQYEHQAPIDLDALLQQVQRTPERIGLPSKDGYTLVDPTQVLFAKAEGSYTRVSTADGKAYLLSKNIKAIEAQLTGDSFLRINRSALVNLDHLTHFSRSDGGFVTVGDGETFSIGSANRQVILEVLERRFTLL